MGPLLDVFWVLFLAHLLADYPLQPDWLVRVRGAWTVRAVHVGIHLAVTLALVGAARQVIWPYAILLAGVHFTLDTLKSIHSSPTDERAAAYLIDQLYHLLSIGGVAVAIRYTLPGAIPLIPAIWPSYAAGYVLATQFAFVTERTVARASPDYLRELVARPWPRMAARALLLTIALCLCGCLVGPMLGLALVPPLGCILAWSYPRPFRRRAFISDVVIAFAVAALILITPEHIHPLEVGS